MMVHLRPVVALIILADVEVVMFILKDTQSKPIYAYVRFTNLCCAQLPYDAKVSVYIITY